MSADVLVLGAGPNGLVAATYLARAGLRVEILEATDHSGGACRSAELTLPGFVHDVGAAFFPFGTLSPALKPLDLEGAGLVWRNAPIDSAHPAPDGTCASIARDVEVAARAFGQDGDAWRSVAAWFARHEQPLLRALLGPLPGIGAFLRVSPFALLKLARVALASGRGLSETWFRSEAARRVIPGLSLHTDVGPDDAFGAVVGFMLAILASRAGFPVPEGGTSAITGAMRKRFEEASGVVHTGMRVKAIIVRNGKAVAVRLADGSERAAKRAIVADVAAPTLYLDMLPSDVVPGRVLRAMKPFHHGFATFKMDWALDARVPFQSEDAANAAVVHAGDSLDDLSRFTAEVRSGALPENPYLVMGQQSVVDPTRAPEGRHTLWCYSRVPFGFSDWKAQRERFADRIEERIEGLAPGFKKHILARAIFAPGDLEAMNANLIGGDLSGGSAQIKHQLFFRPVFPYFRHRTPVDRLYLCSSYTHPGAGVHGACGWNAADAVLRDLGEPGVA